MLELYRRLRYPVADLELVHGVHDPRVDTLLAAHGVTSAVYITAWNPYGVVDDSLTNQIANARLGAELGRIAAAVLPAPGAESESGWVPEESFFALGVDRTTAIELGRRYQQKAIVFVEVGSPTLVLDL